MTKRMLIDASHAEETRVAVVDGNRIEELDFEIASKKQLRGNIYLAKVIRVEPSLQAAFVEYGGNRHGFLAFNEIHPDYFQIPHADREAMMREAAEAHDDEGEGEEVEAHGDDEDEIEAELERRRKRMLRRYKIQEVIRRRQIMLVQVVKEERGNKGAALTTYLSLAGRYCVLMPNTARGGGISRKITNAADRKRLKTVAQGLDVPHGMGLIVRTAGAARTKAEIRRDYEYLLRMWEAIRETTLQSIAPALIYAEEDLVKRAVRDMFDKDFESVEVEGEAGWREARDFMRMLMPSQAKKVVHYRDPTPLFVRHRVEDQLSQIHSPVVPLKSGGYLVINQTEALVAIDVNSGRATRERNIETTAFKTNMEAAAEAARQLRLRDLAGLIVIDFIDMDEGKNNRAVEKEMKDCLKDDRARVQMGKISQFGLMEISRQRRRMGVLEGATHVCEHCHGTGRVRSVESAALAALRAVEMEAVKGGAGAAVLRLPVEVGLYVLNEKRPFLSRLDASHGLHVVVAFDAGLTPGEHGIERTETHEGAPRPAAEPAALQPSPAEARFADLEDEDALDEDEDEDDEEEAGEVAAEPAPRRERERESEGEGRRGRGRRRRRRGGRDDERAPAAEARSSSDESAEPEADEEDGEDEDEFSPAGADSAEGGDGGRRRRRRRGRRGGRRMREEETAPDVYAWRDGHGHAHAASSEGGGDPYGWRDPHGDVSEAFEPKGAAGSRSRDASSPAPQAAPPAAGPQAPAPEGSDPYGWTEADGAAEAAAGAPSAGTDTASTGEGRRRRRGRGRGRGERDAGQAAAADFGEASLAASEPLEPAPATGVVASDAPAPAPASAEPAFSEPAPAAEPVVAERASDEPIVASDVTLEPEPAAATAPVEPEPTQPAPEPEPDPAEISAPPAQPRRGWWRRG